MHHRRCAVVLCALLASPVAAQLVSEGDFSTWVPNFGAGGDAATSTVDTRGHGRQPRRATEHHQPWWLLPHSCSAARTTRIRSAWPWRGYRSRSLSTCWTVPAASVKVRPSLSWSSRAGFSIPESSPSPARVMRRSRRCSFPAPSSPASSRGWTAWPEPRTSTAPSPPASDSSRPTRAAATSPCTTTTTCSRSTR